MLVFQLSLFAALTAIFFTIATKKANVMYYSYKVTEINPYTFEIHVLHTLITDFLWWRKKKDVWVECDCSGRPIGTIHRIQSDFGADYYTVFPRAGRFTNKNAALRQIEYFRRCNVLQSIPHVFQS